MSQTNLKKSKFLYYFFTATAFLLIVIALWFAVLYIASQLMFEPTTEALREAEAGRLYLVRAVLSLFLCGLSIVIGLLFRPEDKKK